MRAFVGGDCYHTNINRKKEPKFCFKYGVKSGAIAIAPYELLKNQKHYNLPHFSHKLFFNVKISLFKKWSII
jgi:hypothetical protein